MNPHITLPGRSFFLITLFSLTISISLKAQSFTAKTPYVTEIQYRELADWLKNAPMYDQVQSRTRLIVAALPLPGGKTVDVSFEESPVMDKTLSARYPQIRSYAFQGVEDPRVSGRLSVSPRGVDAVLFTTEGDVFIEPLHFGATRHKVYYHTPGDVHNGKDDRRFYEGYEHQHDGERHQHNGFDPSIFRMTYQLGSTLRIFRMHVIADGEYSVAVTGGGANLTRANVIAAINAALTGMNVFYVRDMAMMLQLTANVTVYLDPATDPFAWTAGMDPDPEYTTESLTHHQTLIGTDFDGAGENELVPVNTYDVGHLFSGRINGGGAAGIAFLGVVCSDNMLNGLGPAKAGGGSGGSNPQGNSWVELLAHEFTHQFNADHTWSGNSGNCTQDQWSTNGVTSYEPGSGSTIVAYSGICGDDNIPAPGNTGYYHTASIKEVNEYIAQFGTCNQANWNTATGNTAPTPNVNPCGNGNYNIPLRTPFEITGSATDAENAANLAYTWEQFDLANSRHDPIVAPLMKNGNVLFPLFRSFFPSASPTRVFPQRTTLFAGTYNGDAQNAATLGQGNWQGELLPEVNGNINFRLTVRDQNTTAGGVEHADLSLTVIAGTGPFAVTSPNGGESQAAGEAFNVSWNVAGTGPGTTINCANVAIKITTDGGVSYTTLVASTPNDGLEPVTIPAGVGAAGTARIRVECGTSCFSFFDVSNADFSVTVPVPVELAEFKAEPKGNAIELRWLTASEINNEGFELQRSLQPARGFKAVAWIKGHGNSAEEHQYQFTDYKIVKDQTFYYRLKQMDFDGKFEFSDIVSALVKGDEKEVTLSPNPATGQAEIYFKGLSRPKATLRIFAVDGALLSTQEISTDQANKVILDLSGLTKGMYLISIRAGDFHSIKKLIKN